MADLIDKYFQADLTEADEQALSELLASDAEASERFVALSEAAYIRYGLPDPISSGVSTWLKPGSLSLVAGVALLIVLACWTMKSGILTESDNKSVIKDAPVVITNNEATLPAKKVIEQQVIQQVKPVIEQKLVAPPPSDDNTAKSYSLLKVVVEQAVASRVVVRVTGPNGTEVRRLYDGVLQAGQWAFKWDGKLTTGQPAHPGTYTIAIHDGTSVKTRQVQIQ